jgi:hypothetical protein
MNRMQSVAVYWREQRFFVAVIHGSDGGDPCIQSGPVFVVQDVATLGQQILTALDLSRNNVPWPKDWKKVVEPLLSAAGVKSWPAFAKRATSIRVDRSGTLISLRPSSRDEKGAFHDLPEQVQAVDSPSAEAIGALAASLLR